MRSRIATILVLSALCRPALAETAAGGDSDWKPWRSLAVQDGGRQKPLDSLAWETWRMIGNRTSLTDPQSGQVLDATAMYLSMLLDWQGWDQQPSPHRLPAPGENPHQMPASMGVCTGMSQAAAHQPDKWDRCPLILVDAIELRQALGMKEGEKYISPWTSARPCCAILIPRRPLPFLSGRGVWRFARIRPFSPSRKRPSNWPAVFAPIKTIVPDEDSTCCRSPTVKTCNGRLWSTWSAPLGMTRPIRKAPCDG